jgi:hypothetical protein
VQLHQANSHSRSRPSAPSIEDAAQGFFDLGFQPLEKDAHV